MTRHQTDRIRDNLATIATFHQHVIDAPTPPHNLGRTPTTFGSKPPVNLDNINLRIETENDLNFWCRYILDVINDGTITTRIQPGVTTACQFIARWLDTLAEQQPDEIDQLDTDTRKWAHALRWRAQGWTITRINLGPTPTHDKPGDDHDETVTCEGGNLEAVRINDARDLHPEAIICTQCGGVWPINTWLALGRALRASA